MAKLNIKNIVYNNSLVIILILLIVVFSLVNPNYLTTSNVVVILRQASLLAMLGMAQTVVMLTGSIDLSLGSMIAVSTVIFAPMLKSDIPFVIPILLIVITGACLGLLTGLVVTKLNIPPFIATFATNYIGRGTAWLLFGNMIVYNFSDEFRFIGVGDVFGIPVTIILALMIAAMLHILLRKTAWGRRVYFVGSNKNAAIYSGIKVNKVIISAYMFGSVIAAFCGVVYVARLNAAEPGIGTTYALDSIAVTLIGGTSIAGGVGGVFGTITGAVIISTIKNAMNFLQIPSELQSLFMGIIIVSAVYINQFVARKKEQSTDMEPLSKNVC